MSQTITIDDLQGGMSDDHPAVLKPNQVTHAYDVEFWNANVAGRRNGTSTLLSGVGTVTGMFRHTPTNDPTGDLLFTVSSAGTWKSYTIGLAGSTQTPNPHDTFTPVTGVDAVSLHGKLFIACKNSQSRLHVYDGVVLRRVGLQAPAAAPTAVDTAVAGTYATTRYFRTRNVFYDVTLGVYVRSEPSPTLTFTPNGGFNGAIVTKPASTTDGETYWELEESTDNANFYRIGVQAVGLTSITDMLAATSVATTGTLSEDIGDYTTPGSARWLAVDNDRLIMGGDFENSSKDARVSWTPLAGATGVGNDERIPLDNANYIDCDGRNSGGLTGLKAFEGKLVAFKLGQIHTLVRAGTNGSAYLPGGVVRSKGALPYSIVEGFDADGRAVLFFLDPASGPSVYGTAGIQNLTPQLRRTWNSTINRKATVRVCNAVYYADKQQVWWNVSTGANNTPNLRWVYHTQTGGVTFHTYSTGVNSTCMWDVGASRGGNKPIEAHTTTIVQCDDSSATSDAGTAFRAYVRTRAYTVRGLIDKGGVTSGVVEADAASGVTLTLNIIRDYGAETVTKTALLTASGTETIVIVPVDDAFISEAKVVQFEIGDASAASVAAWQLHRMVFKLRPEGRA